MAETMETEIDSALQKGNEQSSDKRHGENKCTLHERGNQNLKCCLLYDSNHVNIPKEKAKLWK